jgi:hypothetical protein
MSFRKYQNRKDWKFKKILGAIKAKDLNRVTQSDTVTLD